MGHTSSLSGPRGRDGREVSGKASDDHVLSDVDCEITPMSPEGELARKRRWWKGDLRK